MDWVKLVKLVYLNIQLLILINLKIFEDVSVLERNVHNKVGRETSERFHIKKFRNDVNLQRESEKLSDNYATVI